MNSSSLTKIIQVTRSKHTLQTQDFPCYQGIFKWQLQVMKNEGSAVCPFPLLYVFSIFRPPFRTHTQPWRVVNTAVLTLAQLCCVGHYLVPRFINSFKLHFSTSSISPPLEEGRGHEIVSFFLKLLPHWTVVTQCWALWNVPLSYAFIYSPLKKQLPSCANTRGWVN